MIISVKQKHIKNGVRRSRSRCPIALALREKFYSVQVDKGEIAFDGKYCGATRSVVRFIDKFDVGKKVKPFNFRLMNVNG